MGINKLESVSGGGFPTYAGRYWVNGRCGFDSEYCNRTLHDHIWEYTGKQPCQQTGCKSISFDTRRGVANIDSWKCNNCGACADNCPVEAISPCQ